MSQRSAKKSHATVQDTVLYELTDYDRQRRPQTLIDDDRVQCVPADPVLKSLSVERTARRRRTHRFVLVSNLSRFVHPNDGHHHVSASFLQRLHRSLAQVREQSLSNVSQGSQVQTLVRTPTPLALPTSLLPPFSLRSDTLTDALIVVVKEQQAKTTQLATSFREQQRCEND